MLNQRYASDGKPVIKLSNTQSHAKEIYLSCLKEKYHLDDVLCECRSDNFNILSEKDRYGLPVRIVICKNCGLIYQTPRMNYAAAEDFYRYLYRDLYETSTIQGLFEEQFIRGKEIVNFIRKNSGKVPQKIVEIGCGAGGILKAFKYAGSQAFGVDFDKKYIDYGIDQGLNLGIGGVNEVAEGSADIVILSHVLEHFSNIQQELNSVKKIMTPNGYLYIELPGIFNLGQYSYDFLKSIQNAHNYYFTLGTLEQVLNRYGWELVAGTENIASLFNYTGIKHERITKNHYQKIMTTLSYYEKTRAIGPLKSAFSITQITKFKNFSINFISKIAS
jgi:SAM-dependent methyltransferase